MKLMLSVVLEELEDKINRQILVDEKIQLVDLCEFVIVSMNGKKIPIYEFECEKKVYYPYEIEETKNEKSMLGLTLKDLKFKKRTTFGIDYNFDKSYYFNLIVDEMIEANDNIDFKVIFGNGYGILDDKSIYDLKRLFEEKRKDYDSYYLKSEKDYLQKKCDINEVNGRISDYKKYKENIKTPKKYIFNISLEGFNKEIKRKISVNSNISINSFCEKVISSMNGDLSHPFAIKIGKNFLEDYYGEFELFYLFLTEKQKLKIIYDFGDNWQFNVTLSKIINSYDEIDFEVLSGKGYGIIDDCGGIFGLYNIFNGEDDSWGKYDINEFNLEECNKIVKKGI